MIPSKETRPPPPCLALRNLLALRDANARITAIIALNDGYHVYSRPSCGRPWPWWRFGASRLDYFPTLARAAPGVVRSKCGPPPPNRATINNKRNRPWQKEA